MGAAPLRGHAAQAVEEQLHPLCIVQPRPAKASGPQAGSTLQGVDDESRIVAQGGAGIMRSECFRFQPRVRTITPPYLGDVRRAGPRTHQTQMARPIEGEDLFKLLPFAGIARR